MPGLRDTHAHTHTHTAAHTDTHMCTHTNPYATLIFTLAHSQDAIAIPHSTSCKCLLILAYNTKVNTKFESDAVQLEVDGDPSI